MELDARELDAAAVTSLLLTRVAGGDRDAFTELYRRTNDRLIGVVMPIVRDRETAADIAHDVLAHAWCNSGHFSADRGNGFTWLAVIARRRAIDRLLADQRYRHKHLREAAQQSMPERSPVEDAIIATESRDHIGRLLGGLTAIERASVVAVYYRGLSQPEAASVAGVPLPTFKSRIQAGMRRLRREIATAA